MISRSLMERLARRLRSSLPLRRRIPVSFATLTYERSGTHTNYIPYSDVIVLTAMGEEGAIEAIEAPRG